MVEKKIKSLLISKLKDGTLKEKKIIIYPFGKNGILTKEILNWQLGIEEYCLVDNELCMYNSKIHKLDDVLIDEKYIWIITVENPSINGKIMEELRNKGVSRKDIINLFPTFLAENNLYSNAFHLLSQAEKSWDRYLHVPCTEFYELTKRKKEEGVPICIAEVGVGLGASAVKVCKILDEKDTYYCFDFEDTVNKLVHDLALVDEINCIVHGIGNTYKKYDSYNWGLSQLVFEMRESRVQGIFDVVYLDGAHTFAFDGLACCLLKELLKPGGYIVFDDLYYSIANIDLDRPNLPSYVDNLKNEYTREQMEDKQVLRVINLFMTCDKNFERVWEWENTGRAVFRKIG